MEHQKGEYFLIYSTLCQICFIVFVCRVLYIFRGKHAIAGLSPSTSSCTFIEGHFEEGEK